MSAFSCFNILKSQAKDLARAQGLKLHEAQEQVARQAKFTNFHDLTTVAKRDPMDRRLMVAALGVKDLEEAVFKDGVYPILSYELSELLSGPMAETHAYGFTMEDLECSAATYIEQTGLLELESTFTYQGMQDPDRGDMGTALYVRAIFRLRRRQGRWIPADDSIEILQWESELDRDWADDAEEEAFQFDPEKEYDLYGETDYSAEGDPEPARHVAPLYRIRNRRFLLSREMRPDGTWNTHTGMVLPRGTAGTDGYPVFAGETTRIGVIHGGYYWRGDGERFRLVEVAPQ